MSAEKDPERWLIADDELANQLRPVLRMARGQSPSASEHARMWSSLAERLSPAADGGNRAASTQGPIQRSAKPGSWRIAGTAVVAAICGFSLAVWLSAPAPARSPARSAPAAATPARMPAQPAPQTPVSVGSNAADSVIGATADSIGASVRLERPSHAIARSLQSKNAARAIEKASAAVSDEMAVDVAGELDLLSRARRILVSEPSRALQLTAEHARRFHDGVLSQEREVLAIEALSRLGRRDLAAARARRFSARYPDSAHRARLTAELEVP